MTQKIQTGFYYHYKHDPMGGFKNYLYEVLNVGHHTEIKDSEESLFVVYRPLYESFVYNEGKEWDVRPLKMFKEKIVLPIEFGGDGEKMVDRFTLITDPELIEKCKKLAEEMY
jgi:hypothetical protein